MTLPSEAALPDWDLRRIVKYLREWMTPAEVVDALNSLASELPLYLHRVGNDVAPLRHAPSHVKWKLDKDGEAEPVAWPKLVDPVFKAYSTQVMEMWPKPAGKRAKSRRGKEEKFDWAAFAGELFRRVWAGEVNLHDKNLVIARGLLNWCGEKWPDDIPTEGAARKKVAAMLDPTRRNDRQ
jgi:hypothetical protein